MYNSHITRVSSILIAEHRLIWLKLRNTFAREQCSYVSAVKWHVTFSDRKLATRHKLQFSYCLASTVYHVIYLKANSSEKNRIDKTISAV